MHLAAPVSADNDLKNNNIGIFSVFLSSIRPGIIGSTYREEIVYEVG